MSIVPQIALVKPNREVQQYVEPSPDALREAISDSNGSGQLTLQKGVYGAQNPGQNITVPLGIDIIVMPGADISRVNFFDSDGNPFPNIFDFNNLGNIASVVNTITAGDGLSVDQPSGDVTLQVPDEGITNDLLAVNAVGTDVLETGNTPSAGQVLAYNGTVMQWQSADVVTENPIGGTGLPGNPVNLKFKDSASISLGTNNNQLVANILDDGITQQMMSENSVGGEQLDIDGVPASDGEYISYQGGLEWKGIVASEVGGGTFGGSSHTFPGNVTFNGNAIFDGTLIDLEDGNGNVRGTIEGTDPTLEITADGQTGDDAILIGSGSGSIQIDAFNVDILAEISLLASRRVASYTNLRVLDDSNFYLETEDDNMENVSDSRIEINSDGYMDFPMYDNNASPSKEPPTPPDGYIRMYAITGGSGNSAGKYRFVEPNGNTATIDIN